MKELLRMQNIGRLRLIAGQAGIERTVTAAVLFEYDPSRMQLPDFYRGDLVVTTLAYARGDTQLVSQSLLALMNQGIAGLLVKTAYFSELPQDVLGLANRLGTPIFLFDDTYIEEVILEVTELIRGKRHFAGYEKEISALMDGKLTAEQIRESVRRIDPLGAAQYRLAALYPRERIQPLEDKLYAFLSGDTQASYRYVCMEWRHMLLILCRMEPGEALRDGEDELREIGGLLAGAGLDADAVTVGVSELRTDVLAFGMALCEAVYAARAARIMKKAWLPARELGLYAYLFPMSENVFVCEQCRRSMARIREYDAQNHTNLAYTAQVYVAERMEIAAAAKALYQHPNTVRYRLTRIQQIMGVTDDALFSPMISLVVNLSRILEEEGKV